MRLLAITLCCGLAAALPTQYEPANENVLDVDVDHMAALLGGVFPASHGSSSSSSQSSHTESSQSSYFISTGSDDITEITVAEAAAYGLECVPAHSLTESANIIVEESFDETEQVAAGGERGVATSSSAAEGAAASSAAGGGASSSVSASEGAAASSAAAGGVSSSSSASEGSAASSAAGGGASSSSSASEESAASSAAAGGVSSSSSASEESAASSAAAGGASVSSSASEESAASSSAASGGAASSSAVSGGAASSSAASGGEETVGGAASSSAASGDAASSSAASGGAASSSAASSDEEGVGGAASSSAASSGAASSSAASGEAAASSAASGGEEEAGGAASSSAASVGGAASSAASGGAAASSAASGSEKAVGGAASSSAASGEAASSSAASGGAASSSAASSDEDGVGGAASSSAASVGAAASSAASGGAASSSAASGESASSSVASGGAASSSAASSDSASSSAATSGAATSSTSSGEASSSSASSSSDGSSSSAITTEVHGEYEEVGHIGTCVSYFLCRDNDIITDGEGLIDIRFGPGEDEGSKSDSHCPNFLDVLCGAPLTAPDPEILEELVGYEYVPSCGHRNPKGLGVTLAGFKDGESQFGEHPWMAIVLEDEVMDYDQIIQRYVCGGSLIHQQVVMTGAHCVKGKDVSSLQVRLGDWDTQNEKEIFLHEHHRVARMEVHERFNSKNLRYDVALLFLEEPVELKQHIDTLCLPEENENFDLTTCVATGYGKDQFHGGRFQNILKEVDLPVVPHRTCQKKLQSTRLGRWFRLHPTFTCAGGEVGVDTCRGDGGSPLACPSKDDPNKYVQVGIVAWGIGCGEGGVPGVYASVPKLVKWVNEKIADHFGTSQPTEPPKLYAAPPPV